MLYKVEHCSVCQKQTGHYNGKCGDCAGRESAEAKRKYDMENAGKSIEDRIKSLEDWRYNTIMEENQRQAGF